MLLLESWLTLEKRNHVSPMLACLHWLPVSFRIDFKILMIMFKVLQGQACSYIIDLLVPYEHQLPEIFRQQSYSCFSDPSSCYRGPGHFQSRPLSCGTCSLKISGKQNRFHLLNHFYPKAFL